LLDSRTGIRRNTFVKIKPAAWAGALGASVLVLAPLTHADSARQLPLRGSQKLTAGPLLGFISGGGPTSAVKLTRIDPRTLRPSGSRSLRLPFADAWAVAPGGRTLALAVHRDPVNEPNSLKLVRLPSLRWQAGSLRLGGDVSGLAWTAPHHVVALVGKFVCCPAPLRVVISDLRARRVLRREPVVGTVLHIARSKRGLVLLTGPTVAIGPASLVVADARGVRTTRLPSICAGEVPGGAGISEWRMPGLAVDPRGAKAYVADPDGQVAEIDLRTLAVSYHEPTAQRSLLARLDGWLEPTASAKGDSGPVRQAQWIGNGFVLVSGNNLHDSTDQLASDPAGLELIDTRNWTADVLAPDADSFTIANGALLVTGARWHGNVNPTGMGLEAYGPDGTRLFALLPGLDVWVDHVASGRAYIAVYGSKRERVVDLRSGRVIGTTTAEAPGLLLGQGSVFDW
jgi:hypothetical protein